MASDLSSTFPYDSILGFAGNMINMGVNYSQNEKWNKKQQENWEKQFSYQKELNNMLMQREDTAVQRKAKDLQAAGFNKLLAATGESAPVSGMTTFGGNQSGKPSQIDVGEYAPFQEYLTLKQLEENIELTQAEREKKNRETLTEIQKENLTRVEAIYKEWLTTTEKTRKKVLEEQAKNIAADTANKARELQISNWSGLPPGTDPRVNNWFQSVSGGVIAAGQNLYNIADKDWGTAKIESREIDGKKKYIVKDATGKEHIFGTWFEANKYKSQLRKFGGL